MLEQINSISFENSLDHNLGRIKLTENAEIVLKKRYLNEGETPEKRFWEMCCYVASAEGDKQKYWAEKFYDELIFPLYFLPNSPTIKNAGRGDLKGGLQACVVISPEDSLDSIYDTIKNWALTEKLRVATVPVPITPCPVGEIPKA